MHRRHEPGSALLIAALAATLLAAAAGGLIIQSRAARAASGEGVRLERARLATDALFAEALIKLDTGDRLPARGAILETTLGRVVRQDAAGLLDINQAAPEYIAALLVTLEIPASQASSLADRIADWRDADDLRRAFGAEGNDYAAGDLSPPTNRPFVVETEIASVLGISDELAHCLAPYITTASGASEVDANAAPDVVRRSLRLTGTDRATTEAPIGRVVILATETPISPHAVLRVTHWVRLTGNPERPILIHRAVQELAPSASSTEPPSCAKWAAA